MPEDTITERFETIPLKQLREAKWNPRKTFDEKKLAELAESIKSKGVIEPLVVREKGSPACGGTTASGEDVTKKLAGYFEIVCGARRFRASKIAKLDAVPCIVRDLSDESALEFAVIENAQRDGLSPLEDAAGLDALLKMPGHDVAEIAARLGRSENFVYQRLRLLKLIDPAKKALAEERLAVGLANLIARLVPKDQETALDCVLLAEQHGGTLRTVKGLAEWIEQTIHLDLSEAPWDLKDPNLVPLTGSCITCTKRTGTMPNLFPDVKRRDTCTDRECFASKRAAWIEKEIAEEKERGHDLIRLSTEPPPLGRRKATQTATLFAGEWSRVGERKKYCNDTRHGIVVEGLGAALGERFKVCVSPRTCEVHGERSAAPDEPSGEEPEEKRAGREERAAAEKKAKRERTERRAILDATLARVTTLDDGDLLAVAGFMINGTPVSTLKAIGERLDWPTTLNAADMESIARAATEDMSRVDLFRLILELALSPALEASVYHECDPRPLLLAAKRHNVDVAGVRKAAHEEPTLAGAKAALKAAGKGKGKRTKKGTATR